ncbi:MAG: 2OG-Fe(II) oxygenase family protein [Alphaproteobacteria bacterium]
MKQRFILLLLGMFALSTPTSYAAADGEEALQDCSIKLFHHSSLQEPTTEVIAELKAEFKRVGFIAVEGVPGFGDAYQQFLATARIFADLSKEEQAVCTGATYAARGWSRGVEVFNGKTDTYKGSYYAVVPDDSSNVWPDENLPQLRNAYQNVATIVLEAGKQILPLVGFTHENVKGLGRMLHYKSVAGGEDDGNANWCGDHRDHGVFTCLCPEAFYRDGEVVSRPANSGLYIEGRPVGIPLEDAITRNVVFFQMGEVIELMTKGEVRATNHLVKKATDGSERFALAVFVDPIDEVIINFGGSSAEIIDKYKDRLTEEEIVSGIVTFDAWNTRSLAKYNPKELAPTTA